MTSPSIVGLICFAVLIGLALGWVAGVSHTLHRVQEALIKMETEE